MEPNLERAELEKQAEAAFAHMQELMDRLEEVKAKDECFRKASHANLVIKYNRGVRPLQNEYDDLKARSHWAKVGNNTALQDSIAKLIDYREGPLTMFKQLLQSELKNGDFESVEEAKKFRMKQEELDALKAGLDAYRKEYQDSLEECQRLDVLLSEGEEPEEEAEAAQTASLEAE